MQNHASPHSILTMPIAFPDPPLTTLYIPYPVNINVTSNTFVRFRDRHGSIHVGLIVKVNPEDRSVKLHLFFKLAATCGVSRPG